MLTIARALMMKPRLLMLDEPTLGLAPVILEQDLQSARAPAPVQRHHRAARRAECHLRPPHADRVYVWSTPASSGKARPPSSPRVLAQRICRSDSKDRQRQMPPHGKSMRDHPWPAGRKALGTIRASAGRGGTTSLNSRRIPRRATP